MKTIFKTIIALIITALVPVVEYLFLIVLFAGLVLLGGDRQSALGLKDFADMFMWASLMMIFPFPVAIGWVFLFGVPTLLVGWYFRAIRWWSVLIAAFLIGAVPSTLSVLFAPIGWPENTYVWQDLSPENLILVAMSIIIMGFAGLSGGLVFWLLWRYWVSPHSPAGRPLPLSPRVEINSSGANELKVPDTA
jgi:hypothetical protein